MEPPVFNREEFERFKDKTPIVKDCDMDPETRKEAMEHISTGIDKNTGAEGIDTQNAAKFIKEAMDRQFGPSWHCIIGEGYSFEITR